MDLPYRVVTRAYLTRRQMIAAGCPEDEAQEGLCYWPSDPLPEAQALRAVRDRRRMAPAWRHWLEQADKPFVPPVPGWSSPAGDEDDDDAGRM